MVFRSQYQSRAQLTEYDTDSAIVTSEMSDDYGLDLENREKGAQGNAYPFKDETGKQDGEQAMYIWVVVLIGFFSQFIGIGITVAWGKKKTKNHKRAGKNKLTTFFVGIMQDRLEKTQYGSSGSVVIQLSLVASISDSLLNLMGILAQYLLNKYSLRLVMVAAAILCTASLEAASFSTEVWHLILSVGVAFGTGASVFFYASTSIIPQWFEKRQGIAQGIVSSGSCVGGLLLPFIMTSLNNQYGTGWCFRVLGMMSFVIFIFAAFSFKQNPKEKGKSESFREIVDFSVLKNTNLLIWCLADNVIEAGYYVPYFFLPSHATLLGFSDTETSLLISLSSTCNACGRIIGGYIGDRIGYINITIICSMMASLSAFAIWTVASDFGTLLTFACVYGMNAGIFASLSPSITRIVEKDSFESAYTMFLILTAISFYGLNVAAAIESSIHLPNFLVCKIFTGSTYLIGIVILIILKLRLSKGDIFSRL